MTEMRQKKDREEAEWQLIQGRMTTEKRQKRMTRITQV